VFALLLVGLVTGTALLLARKAGRFSVQPQPLTSSHSVVSPNSSSLSRDHSGV
jgi:hypothetical protein